jgi:hypothetical protein
VKIICQRVMSRWLRIMSALTSRVAHFTSKGSLVSTRQFLRGANACSHTARSAAISWLTSFSPGERFLPFGFCSP